MGLHHLRIDHLNDLLELWMTAAANVHGRSRFLALEIRLRQ